MRVLSIDWDYFFPNGQQCDWSAHEMNPFLWDVVWTARSHWRNRAGEIAVDFFRPTIPANFWENVATNALCHVAYMAESHMQISYLLEHVRSVEVVSLDAHHDFGYQPVGKEYRPLDCSNWVYYGFQAKQIRKFRLYYPEWRKKDPETGSRHKALNISYGLPPRQRYDIIFVCRSGAWTPSWSDAEFREFLRVSPYRFKPMDELITKDRQPDLPAARECARNLIEVQNQMHDLLNSGNDSKICKT